MPSLRKRVSTYFRQLSFHNEPRSKRNTINDNAFVTKYLQGHISLIDGPRVISGKIPTDLPNYSLAEYQTGYDSIISCHTGPHGGLTTIRRVEKYLSLPDADDFDFIDTQQEEQVQPKKSPKRIPGQPVDNTKMVIKVAGQEYSVKNDTKRHKKSLSLGSLSDFNLEIDKTKIDVENVPKTTKKRASNREQTTNAKETRSQKNVTKNVPRNYNVAKSKSETNPFRHKGGRKTVDVRPNTEGATALPPEWNRCTDYVYGISDSLYDRNLVTKVKNGDPVADCFGVIARKDSVILAVADGVNWGEKACLAAKAAIHGCLHYLNKTLFNDTKLFDSLTVLSDQQAAGAALSSDKMSVSNTRDVFVSLLRSFNCAHDLILENNGMLTTLTVAVVLPLKDGKYACCVCNVGDTLAYIYSGKYGVRELTKGSHDINSNRDMRDALGALGPVDGINPELSNLTLSITTLDEGDIVIVASDGLTDNFDPNVCRFTVNSTAKINSVSRKNLEASPNERTLKQPNNNQPVKPPRRSHLARAERADSVKSNESKKSTSTENSTNDKIHKENVVKVDENLLDNPLVAHFVKQNSVEEEKTEHPSSTSKETPTTSRANNTQRQGYSFLRSKTTIDFHSTNKKPIFRDDDGIPYVTPIQRYELQLLLIEEILKHGISGQDQPCSTSKQLCENLVSFTKSMTAAKRRTLEDMELYFDNRDGVLVEVSAAEKKLRRKKGLEKVLSLPGKLDHVTVVACNVGQVPLKVQFC